VKSKLIYRNRILYNCVMRLLYGRHYACRGESVADLIPAGSSVVDLCCGPAVLYERHLSRKHITYTGIDGSERFIARVKQLGGHGILQRISTAGESLPAADYVVMQGSLAYFLPDPSLLIDRMLAAARKGVIIAEPVRNLSSSRSALVRRVAIAASGGPGGEQPQRFTEQMLDDLFARYRVDKAFLIPGGREKVYFLAPQEHPGV